MSSSFLLFSLPLDKQKLLKMNMSGVYFFIKEDCKSLSNHAELSEDQLKKLTILYIGKAKSLRQRLLSYKIFSSQHPGAALNRVNSVKNTNFFIYQKEDAHEPVNHEDLKKNRLGLACQTLALKLTDTHLEACLAEIDAIKTHQPVFNKKLKTNVKSVCVQVYPRAVAIVSKKEACENTLQHKRLQIIGHPKKIRLFFASFVGVLQALEHDRPLHRVGFDTRAWQQNKLCLVPESVVVKTAHGFQYSLLDEFQLFLRGKKNKILEHIYQDILAASSRQDYLQAAKLRDLYLHLKALHKLIHRSVKLWRLYQRVHFSVFSAISSQQKTLSFHFLNKTQFILNFEKVLLLDLWRRRKWENLQIHPKGNF